MNTNKLKTFAKEARKLFLTGVTQKLLYWGFDKEGNCADDIETIEGGYIFRSNVYQDATVPLKWKALKNKIKDQQSFIDVTEEAAYTWFNRLMAIKILEKKGFDSPVLEYTNGSKTPAILQQATRGLYKLKKKADQDLLNDFFRDNDDDNAFSLLITDYCNQHLLLKNVFGKINDYTELLSPNNLLTNNGILDWFNNSNLIEDDEYKEGELIGWLYQFYISDRKDEVFAGFKQNKKARAEDIPAATQIFTPKWIVKYMVENTIGKIYLDFEPNSSIKSELKYLVENDSQQKSESIINDITDLTLLDPACGSGHILVTAFELLFKMYREKGYMARQAVENILKYNLFGLDIDDRAMQLARFAVLLKAADYDSEILKKGILPHIYSFPENNIQDFFSYKFYNNNHSDWQNLQGMKLRQPLTIEWTETVLDPKTKKEVELKKKISLKVGEELKGKVIDLLEFNHDDPICVDYSSELERFWGIDEKSLNYSSFFYAIELLKQGKNLGSVIKIKFNSKILNHLQTKFESWQLNEEKGFLSLEELTVWNRLKPFLVVMLVLAKKYTSVAANPPYMGQQNMNIELKDYVNTHYPISKADLFAVFIEVCLSLSIEKGLMGMINQHSWMFLSSYEKLREEIISKYGLVNMLHLGPRTFDELSGEVVQSTTFIIENEKEVNSGIYYRLVDYRTNTEKENNFLKGNNRYAMIPQINFSKIPGSPLAYWVSAEVVNLFLEEKIKKYGISDGQNITGNNNIYLKSIWEVNKHIIGKGNKWVPIAKGGSFRKWFGNIQDVIDWSEEAREFYRKDKIARIQDKSLWFRFGITWNLVSSGGTGFRLLEDSVLFNKAAPTILFDIVFIYKLQYVLGFLNTNLVKDLLNILNPTFNTNIAEILSLPLIEKNEIEVTQIVDNAIQLSKIDWNFHEISWDFEQSPLLNESLSLKKAYKIWQVMVTQDFFHLHSNEEELNRIFIDIYGLHEELKPNVHLKDITILQEELDRNVLEKLESVFRDKGKDAVVLPIKKDIVISQFISYSIGVLFGRFRLDKSGLHIAHPNPSVEELDNYEYNGHSINIDEDAIIPLIGNDSPFSDDIVLGVKKIIEIIWGEDKLNENLNFLQDCLEMELEKFLTEKFWNYHVKMYQKKPIYWLFSSEKGFFKVLVYMHRMDKYILSKIRNNYLHKYQSYLSDEVRKMKANEAQLNRNEQNRLTFMQNAISDCAAYDELLKSMGEIEIDLDDGVTVNYAKFGKAVKEF